LDSNLQSFMKIFVLLLFLACAMAACNCMTKKQAVQDNSLQLWMFASVICVWSLLMLVLFKIVSSLMQKIAVVFYLELSWSLEVWIYPPWRCSLCFIPAARLLQQYNLGLHYGILCHSASALLFCFIPVCPFQSFIMKMLMLFCMCWKSCHWIVWNMKL
jgi:hypothetical protein